VPKRDKEHVQRSTFNVQVKTGSAGVVVMAVSIEELHIKGAYAVVIPLVSSFTANFGHKTRFPKQYKTFWIFRV
jgi:hypothetical protein